MSLVVNTNINSIMVKNNLSNAVGNITLHMQRLSSGLRINSASDDAAGLGLSKKISAQISASDIAKDNTQTGINMLQVADSDLSAIGTLLQKMRDLSVQASNGVYSSNERLALQTQNTQLITEITRIAGNSNFSEMHLLDGSISGALNIQTGTNASGDNQININSGGTFNSATAVSLGVNGITVSTASGALTALSACDTAIQNIATRRANIGSMVNRLSGSSSRLDSRKTNLESANSVICDTDVASEAAGLTKSQILQQTSAALLQQANQLPSIALKLVES